MKVISQYAQLYFDRLGNIVAALWPQHFGTAVFTDHIEQAWRVEFFRKPEGDRPGTSLTGKEHGDLTVSIQARYGKALDTFTGEVIMVAGPNNSSSVIGAIWYGRTGLWFVKRPLHFQMTYNDSESPVAFTGRKDCIEFLLPKY